MRILIVDDSALVRRGVRGLLSSEKTWEVCDEAADGADGLLKARELQPDIILLDVSMPGQNGLDTARALRQEVPSAKILMMSQNDATQMLSGVIEAGAHGCVDKSRLSEDLLPAIKGIWGVAS